MSEPQQIKPARIEVRAKSLTDEHVKELIEFYDDLKKKDKDLIVNVKQESSSATKTFIQIDFYSEDDTQIDGLMLPYKE